MNDTAEKATQCVLASGNEGKLAELSDALASLNIEMVSQKHFNVSEAVEDAPTFVENALKKARHASAATGLWAMADDSGLVVPALNGEPGVISARYAATPGYKPTDQDNIDKLLTALSELPDNSDRTAYFVCVLTFLRHANDPEPVIATGVWHGSIVTTQTDEGGFGYDPVFYCPIQKQTAAAMGKDIKRTISHRAIALNELKTKLASSSL